MSLLRNALILVLACSAAPALAEQITCESRQSSPEACGTIQPGSTVRLVRQLGDTPCVEGRNWGTGAAHDSLWVSQGCRAVFDVQAQSDQTASSRADESGGDRAERDLGAGAQGDPYSQSRDPRLSSDDRSATRAGPVRNDDREDEADNQAGDRVEDQPEDRNDEARDEDRASHDERAVAGGRGDEESEDRGADSQVAAAGHTRAVARQACIDEAAAGQSFGPDDVTATDVRWIGHGLLIVELQTPDGDLSCTVDRDGNVRSVDR